MSMSSCDRCHIGRLKAARVPYFAWLEGYMVVVPDVTAEVCDVCGLMRYNPDFKDHMEDLIDLHTVGESRSRNARRQFLLDDGDYGNRLKRSI